MQASICTMHPITSIKEELAFHWASTTWRISSQMGKVFKCYGLRVKSELCKRRLFVVPLRQFISILLLRLLTFTCFAGLYLDLIQKCILYTYQVPTEILYLTLSCESERVRIEHVLTTNTIPYRVCNNMCTIYSGNNYRLA